ncbi:MAG: DUF501 domain-containing protein [Coriobacteriia bacterium]|nr:DUF501 domain-containing protein [Coriobacteriia bacterium]
MTSTTGREADAAVVAAQIGRVPRQPWRVAARCSHGYPMAIVPPPILDGGDRFPTYAWLTCPSLAEKAAVLESAGAAARMAGRVAGDPALAERVRAADRALRAARAAEGRRAGDEDACSAIGIAGQRDPLRVKCLHARAALALVGIDDPIGTDIVEGWDPCPDAHCLRYLQGSPF